MEFIVCNYIQRNRKTLRREAFPTKKRYNRLVATAAAKLLDISAFAI